MSILTWVRTLLRRNRLEAEMAEEMKAHIEARAADLFARGIPQAEAERRARIEFGSRERYREEGREARGFGLVDRLRCDLRVTYRSLWKSPAFTITAVATLAIGIGANAVVFSVLNGVVLKPLPYPSPERLYTARTVFANDPKLITESPVSGPLFAQWRRACVSCENVALIGALAVNLGDVGEPQRVDALSVGWQLFPMLGTRMQLGRAFTPEDDQPGANNVVVISDALWRSAFAGERSVIGRKVLWNSTPVEVIGVLPPEFRFPKREQMGSMTVLPDRVDLIRPMGTDPAKLQRVFMWSALFQLRSGVRVEQALAEINQPARNPPLNFLIRLLPLKERMIGEVRRPLLVLVGAAAVLLLIVCVNLGNLLLVRAAGRHRDWAIRSAIGASRMDLVRGALTESVTLALIGGLLGVAAAVGGVKLISTLASSTLPRLDEVAVDWRVLLATLAISAAAGVVCGLAPVWRILRADPQQALAAGSLRATETRLDRRIRNALVGSETGLSMALAVMAGLLIVSFVRVMDVDKGFDTQHVLTFQMSLEGQYAGERRAQYHRDLLEKLRSMPGVVSAGLTSQLPLQGEMFVSNLRRPGDTRPTAETPRANYRFISPGYLQATGIAVRSGRSFEDSDRERHVAILSERAAREVFPGEDPIGQEIEFGVDDGVEHMQVVGVVADVKTTGLETRPPSIMYVPYWWLGLGTASYVVRASGQDAGLIAGVRAAAASVAKDVPLHRIQTMEQIVDTAAASRRLQTLLAAGFAGAGVLLTCLGVFGVVSYGVSRRTGEIGVRMALGATQRQVLAMVLRESMWPVVVGLAAGAVTALALGRVLAAQLFGVRPDDPAVLGGVAALVCIAALLAAYWPARRAARIEPVQALRWE